MTFPESAYMSWAKAMPAARINLARSGVDPCPPELLRARANRPVVNTSPGYGAPALRHALALRYGVSPDRVFPVSGGASMANWLACAAALDGTSSRDEVIVEQPTYEPLLRAVEALGCKVKRLRRRFDEGYAIALPRLERLVTQRTRLVVVTDLHNPSGAYIDPTVLRGMSEIMRDTGGYVLVDEVYLECLFGPRAANEPASGVHAGDNVIATNSLTKAYGLDGLRAGWLLGPSDVVRRAGRIFDLMGVNSVAPGEQLAVAALHNLTSISRRAHAMLDHNLERLRRFCEREPRLEGHLPVGGTVFFPRLPDGVDGDAFSARLRDEYSTLVVPGRFFDSPAHVRISLGCPPAKFARGLVNISRALHRIRPRSR